MNRSGAHHSGRVSQARQVEGPTKCVPASFLLSFLSFLWFSVLSLLLFLIPFFVLPRVSLDTQPLGSKLPWLSMGRKIQTKPSYHLGRRVVRASAPCVVRSPVRQIVGSISGRWYQGGHCNTIGKFVLIFDQIRLQEKNDLIWRRVEIRRVCMNYSIYSFYYYDQACGRNGSKSES